MIKRMIIMLVFVIVIIGGMIGFKFMMAQGTKDYLSTQPIPAQTVSTVNAVESEWRQEIEAVGSLRAINGIDVAAEIPGILDRIPFESGADVEQGAVLAHLRDDEDIAKLKMMQAAADLAKITLERDQKQHKAQAVSQATIDNDTATLNAAIAQVEAQKAMLDKKTLRAPFAGRLGVRQASVGQFINAGSPIVTLQQLDPIYVDFNLPEQELPMISSGQKIIAHVDAFSGLAFEGEISAINSKVDEATRNVNVRATFKNPERKLLPGMFAHVVITTGEPKKFITLPQTSITYNTYGNTVYVVEKGEEGKLIASQKFVTLGDMRGDQVAVLSGVAVGEEVVSSGQLKLRNGMPLKVNNEIQPSNDPNPKPEDK